MLFSTASSASAAGPNAVRTDSGCTTNTFSGNDDEFLGGVPIGFTADFFGASSFNQVFLNNNGNLTVNSGVSEYTPFDFTTSGDVMIAPFLADVDTRAGSPVTYGTTTVGGHTAFCVNWVDVGYYNTHIDKTNSFQLLLIDRSDTGAGNFDIEFNYDRISWETGDASGGSGGFGGTSAEVGYANGDGDPAHFFVRDGSFENGALLDGGPKALTAGMLNSGGQLGRYVFLVRNTAPTGTLLTGEVQSPPVDGNTPQPNAPVEICRSGGSCISRFTNNLGVYRAANLTAGNYTITAHSCPGCTEYNDATDGPLVVSGTPGSTLNHDVVLGDQLTGPPDGTTLEGIGESGDGVPVIYWSDSSPLAMDVPDGCTPTSVTFNVTVEGVVVHDGIMTQGPTGHWTATIPPLLPASGPGIVHIDVNGDPPCNDIGFGIYIDPSGVVRNANTGALIPDATVTLFRSASASGPFIQVPDGSGTMSPGNRNNPDFTDSNGHFGWDVIAGYYKVVAEAEGCTPGSTAVMSIPPPVTNLDIGLSCPTSGGGGGGGGAAQQPLTTAPSKKKCKKKKKGRSAVVAKKCKKKKKRSAAAASNPFGAHGLLFIGGSEAK
jgi:Nidogen-like